LRHFEIKHSRPASPAGQHGSSEPGNDFAEHPVATTKTKQTIEPDPEITNAQDDATANVQVIENKPILPAGAQQPPSPDPQPNLGIGQSPNATRGAQDAIPDSAAPPAQPGYDSAIRPNPTIQSISAPQLPATAPAPQMAPGTGTPSRVPDGDVSAVGDRRSSVVIPDSLKGLPAAAPASSLDPPTIPEETSRSLVLHRVEPLYPAQAISQRLDGPVVLQVRVAMDGSIHDLKLVRGYFLLGRAAYDAVKQWRFKPYAPNGKPIEFLTNVTIIFKFPS
jgi:TonB family protein